MSNEIEEALKHPAYYHGQLDLSLEIATSILEEVGNADPGTNFGQSLIVLLELCQERAKHIQNLVETGAVKDE